MNIKDVRNAALAHRLDKNYHFRDLTDAEYDAKAEQSWNKLTPEQQVMVKKTWGEQLKVEELWSEAKKDELLLEIKRLRFLCQTNLYFLCKLLNYYLMTDGTHEDICNEFFVRKDPTLKHFKAFADAYKDTGELKRRLLMVPRGGFKSTINMADCVQWIISFPEIRIAILTGRLDLAEAFVGEVRGHFEYREIDKDAKGKPMYGPKQLRDADGEPFTSIFQVMFPEHCVKPSDGSGIEFMSPATSGGPKEKTVEAGSIEQTLSGFHYDILKLDDVVTNENSTTPDRIEKVNRQISINRGMLHPYGFFDVIGTWYDEADYYGVSLAHEEKMAKMKGLAANIKGSIESGIYNSHVHMKCYVRAAWIPKKSSLGKPEAERVAEDYDYWFPERLNFEFLTEELEEDEIGFAIKYLNNPRLIGKVRIPRDLLIKRTIPHTQMPPAGKIVTVVDTAYSTKGYADYTVILTAMIYAGRFYIINMKRGRWNEYDLPIMIANVAYQWKPERISIEESVGVAWLAREIRREMAKHSIQVPLELVSLGKGSKKTAKAQKAKPFIRMLHDERIYILMSCEGREEIYNELELFTGTKDDKHDDIVSGFSLLVDQYGSFAAMDAAMPRQHYGVDQKSREMHNMIYGLGKYASMGDNNPVTVFQVESALSHGSAADPYYDPLADAGLY